MTAEEIMTLYDKWQLAKKEVEAYEDILDVENSKSDAAQYELLYKARIDAFREFENATKQADQLLQQHVKKLIAVRREDAREARPEAR